MAVGLVKGSRCGFNPAIPAAFGNWKIALCREREIHTESASEFSSPKAKGEQPIINCWL
jgi:hypothetical protein